MERNELKKVSIKIFDDIIKIEDFNFDSKSYKIFLIYSISYNYFVLFSAEAISIGLDIL